jgi:hypothetical protein
MQHALKKTPSHWIINTTFGGSSQLLVSGCFIILVHKVPSWSYPIYQVVAVVASLTNHFPFYGAAVVLSEFYFLV